MTNTSKIDSLQSENQKLSNYVSLVLAELELTQRVIEIKENLANSIDSERIITPIMDRISRIQSEKLPLEED